MRRGSVGVLASSSLLLLCALSGCGFDELSHIFDPPPTNCAAFVDAAWRVGRDAAELEVSIGDSSRQSVTPGFPTDCGGLTSVTWSVDDPSVASVTPLGPRNAGNDTAEDISRAWITGLAPGLTTIRARILFADGTRDAQPKVVRVVPAEPPPPGSFIIAQGTATFTFNQFTGAGGSELVPLNVPAAGRLDISVDWTSFQNSLAFSLWEGTCSVRPCPGRQVIASNTGLEKPHREFVDNLAAGEYTASFGGVGTGSETATYVVRLTPD